MILIHAYLHLHETWQIGPWSNLPSLCSWTQLYSCAENGQTNAVAFHYFVQWLLSLPCFDENDNHQASLSDKLPNDQHNKHQHSIWINASSTGGMSFYHDCHIPSQRADRCRDNKPSISKVCWFFFKVMPHLINLYHYRTAGFRFFICILSKLAYPFQYSRSRNIKQFSNSIQRQSVHIENNSQQLLSCWPSSRSSPGKLMATLLTFVSLSVTKKSVLNRLDRTAFRTIRIHNLSSCLVFNCDRSITHINCYRYMIKTLKIIIVIYVCMLISQKARLLYEMLF